MDLSRCTEGQRETVETLASPLMVAAGAGSGKTFTLTQRIVHAFSPGTGEGGAPFLDSIGQVLAITFTRKAAAELRSRVKELLAAEGLAGEALAVDDAFIGTIHGMAGRILRENALELGIDPAFEVCSEALQDELLHEAVDEVIDAADALEDGELRAFLAAEALFGRGEHGRGLVDEARALMDRALSMPEGLDGAVVASPRRTPRAIMEEMAELGGRFLDHGRGWQKPGATEQKAIAAAEAALEGAERWLSSDASSAPFGDAAFDADGFRAALYAFLPTSGNAPTKKNRSEFFDDYDLAYARLSEEAEASMGAGRARLLLRLAREIDRRYGELKGPDRFDDADLLRRCARALREHPVIAERYREKFRLIMVDEFQDTDNLQVELIGLLARPGLSNVCAVGDAQQSIYRFRGADVNVFFAYGERLAKESPEARFPKLDANFRSHGDVLGLVERVFSQREAFGNRFLSLSARGKVNAAENPLFLEAGEAQPRAFIDVVAYNPRARGPEKTTSADALAVAAAHVADHFAGLRERGADPGSMALLLGSMANARVYAEALRSRGIESAITGGSVFAASREAVLVGSLLRFAVNRDDGPALLEVLTSPLFALSDDVLLALCTRYDENGRLHYADLARGFARARAEGESLGLVADDAEALRLAVELLDRFAADAAVEGRGGTGRALRALLAESGLLDRLQGQGAEGLARAGDLQKACLLVEGFERAGHGIASTALAYGDHLRTAKEAPGMLASAGSQPLRIMTIHASKGLQFDHVAVAEAGNAVKGGAALAVENIGRRTFASYAAPASNLGPWKNVRSKLHGLAEAAAAERWADGAAVAEYLSGDPAALEPGEARSALKAWEREQVRAEAQRLLYVGLTRAVESVMLSIRTSAKPDDDYAGAGIYREVFTAFPWDAQAQHSRSLIGFGGSAPAQVDFERLVGKAEPEGDEAAQECHAQGAAGAEGEAEPFVVTLREPLPRPAMAGHGFGRENVRSYSSLDHSAYGLPDADSSGNPLDASVASMLASETPSNDVPLEAFRDIDDAVGDPEAEAALLSYGADEDATALGTAFHRLAQLAIERARKGGEAFELKRPDEAAVSAQIRGNQVSASQAARLDAALDRWFASSLSREFAAHESIAAEVPFTVRIDRVGRQPLYLEGEIDGLAFDTGRVRAFFIDYKTGGRDDESPEQLHAKHLQQAQCYAYALMRSGFASVEAHFVRVERPDPAVPSEPSVVAYSFDAAELPALEAAIIAAAD